MILFVFAFFSRLYTWFLKREWLLCAISTAQRMKLSVKDFFSKYDQICRKLRIWSRLLTKSLMENFIFWCSVPICFIFYNQKATPFGKVTRFVLFKWMLLCFIFIKNKKYTFTSIHLLIYLLSYYLICPYHI